MVRVLLGLSVLALWGPQVWDGPGRLLGLDRTIWAVAMLPPAAALAVGWCDRTAALLLFLPTMGLALEGFARLPLATAPLLFVHALTPAAPFGSLEARGRTDPDGGWRLPRWVPLVARLALLLLVLESARRGDLALLEPGWLPLFLLAAPVATWTPAGGDDTTRVFYDGRCGLCHRTVRLLLAEDTQGRMRFAPLLGPTHLALQPQADLDGPPDSVRVLRADGVWLERSDAALHLLARLGGLWRVAAALGRLVPRPLRDLEYDLVASARHHLFPRTEASCPRVDAQLRERFDP